MLPTVEPGIKIAIQASPEPSAEELALIQQLGVEWVVLWTNASKASYDYFASRRKLFESHGIRIYGFGNWDVHNQDAIVLGLEGRQAKLEQYKRHLRDLGRAGIPYTTYAHMANGIWSTERETTRGGAPARAPSTPPKPKKVAGSICAITRRCRMAAPTARRRSGRTLRPSPRR